MQFNTFPFKKSFSTSYAFLFKLFIFLFALGYIVYQLKSKDVLIANIYNHILPYVSFLLYLSFFLVPINWSVEAWKWSFLASKIEKLSFVKATEGTLTGLALGMVTPFSLGEYLGRVLQANSAARTRLIGAVFFNKVIQFFVTLFFGGIALVYFLKNGVHYSLWDYCCLALGIINISFLLLLFYPSLFYELIKKLKVVPFLLGYFKILTAYHRKDVIVVICASFLRYLIFSLQFVLILTTFKVSNDITLLFTSAWFVFLAKSVVPTFFDFGVRETSAIYFFKVFNIHSDDVLFASISLWLMNVVLPAFVGLILVFKIKLSAK